MAEAMIVECRCAIFDKVGALVDSSVRHLIKRCFDACQRIAQVNRKRMKRMNVEKIVLYACPCSDRPYSRSYPTSVVQLYRYFFVKKKS